MRENKVAKVPIASHGLHKHDYNYPWLSSINFGDVMPCYYNPLRKGNKDSVNGGLYSQLMPIAHNAFATGRYQFKAVFVPYKLAWRPWYAFDQQTEYGSNAGYSIPNRFPYVTESEFIKSIKQDLCFQPLDGSDDDYDIKFFSPDPDDPGGTTGITSYAHLTNEGCRVMRILGALGCMPSFVETDTRSLNILSLLCYIKAYSDYYFPNNYVGNTEFRTLQRFFESDITDFTSVCHQLLSALSICSLNFYESSIFDLAWDNPVTPNVNNVVPPLSITDVSDPDNDLGTSSFRNTVENDTVSSGTPAVTNSRGIKGFTQYILDALQSVNNWAKRNQLAGSRLLDRFLVSRGLTLSNDSARISYLVGTRNVEIEVSGVENNTNVNLGELAGRGIASTGRDPLKFECNPDDDGIFFVIVSPLPDANFPILTDGFATRVDYMDNYHAEFDKLGCSSVPSRVIQSNLDGFQNYFYDRDGESVFGFLSQYWDEVQERPRLLGDFILKSRGAEELQAYHTFRLLSSDVARHHSYNFVKMSDNSQYQRLFYSDQQENLMLFIRWFGSQYKEKLPLGESYDWDDDELNKKVSVVVGGSQS